MMFNHLIRFSLSHEVLHSIGWTFLGVVIKQSSCNKPFLPTVMSAFAIFGTLLLVYDVSRIFYRFYFRFSFHFLQYDISKMSTSLPASNFYWTIKSCSFRFVVHCVSLMVAVVCPSFTVDNNMSVGVIFIVVSSRWF